MAAKPGRPGQVPHTLAAKTVEKSAGLMRFIRMVNQWAAGTPVLQSQ